MIKRPLFFFGALLSVFCFHSLAAADTETVSLSSSVISSEPASVAKSESADSVSVPSAADKTQAEPNSSAPTSTEADSHSSTTNLTADSPEKEISYEDIFKWGMETQILETLKKITEAGTAVPREQLETLYRESLSAPIRAACLDYWREKKDPFLYDDVLGEWSEIPVRETVLQQATLNYLFAFLPEKQDEKTIGILGDVLRYADYGVKSHLLSLIAEKQLTAFEPVLLEAWKTADGQTAFQAAVLKTLGKLKTGDAFEILKAQLENTDLSTDLRMAAAEGLGGYETADAYGVLESFMTETNIYLRLKIFDSLLSTKNPNLKKTIEQGGKDGYWQIRRSVFRFIGENGLTEYAPMMLFKAKNEPERSVRETVIRQLGKMDLPEIRTYLQETVRNEKNPMTTRKLAFDALGGYKYAQQIPFLMDLWTRYKDKPTGTIAEHMAMRLSVTEEAGLDVMYELFFLSPVGLFKLYALRGIGLNHSQSCRAEIEKMRQSDKNDQLTRAAKAIDYGDGPVSDPAAAASETKTGTPAPVTETEPMTETSETEPASDGEKAAGAENRTDNTKESTGNGTAESPAADSSVFETANEKA